MHAHTELLPELLAELKKIPRVRNNCTVEHAPPGAQEVALSVHLCVCLSVTFMNSSLNLNSVSQQSLGSLSAVSLKSLVSISALSLTSLALSFLIHFIILRAYFNKPAEHNGQHRQSCVLLYFHNSRDCSQICRAKGMNFLFLA